MVARKHWHQYAHDRNAVGYWSSTTRKMRNWTKVRKRNAEILYKTLSASAEHAIRIPFLKCDGCNKSCATNYCSHAWYRAYVFIRKDALHEEWSRNRILAELLEAGVPCSQGACPEIYLEKAFQNLSPCDIDRLPTAKLLGEESIAFSVHPTIDKKTMLSIAQITRDVIERQLKENCRCSITILQVGEHIEQANLPQGFENNKLWLSIQLLIFIPTVFICLGPSRSLF